MLGRKKEISNEAWVEELHSIMNETKFNLEQSAS